MSGQFAGFIRNLVGKRRLLLRTATGDVELKVPAELREAIHKRLHAGQEITVSGVEDGPEARARRVVSRICVDRAVDGGPQVGEAACVRCPIQVCTKKNCWRGGGKELWRALEIELRAAGLDEELALQPVDCLDNCKRGPNLTCNGELLERCSPREAREFVQQLAGHPATATAEIS